MYVNRNVIYVGVFVAGGATGFIVGRKLTAAQYNKLIDAELEELKTKYRVFKIEEEEKEVTENDNVTKLSKVLSEKNESNRMKIPMRETPINQYEQAKIDYHLIPDVEEEVDVEVDTDVNEEGEGEKGEGEEKPKPIAKKPAAKKPAAKKPATKTTTSKPKDIEPKVDDLKPYIISDEEFNEECDTYSKITLYYYQDGVLCDEGEVLIDDIDHTIGKEALSELVNAKGKINTLYVRNDAISADYEIVIMNSPYGEDDTEAARRRKRHEE